MTVRTRIAPSPTGQDLHIGNLYTALFNWAYARRFKGQFIVRIEDTDQQRRVEKGEERILQTLKTYGLDYDEGVDVGGPYSPYRQSERLEMYKKYAEELVANGHAYYCTCSKERLEELRKKQIAEKKVPKYDKHCLRQVTSNKLQVTSNQQYVIRLNVPDSKEVTFHDEIRGNITFHTNDIDDQVLVKSDGFPTYHLAVVVDDHLMQISHVIRGEEWISSTPKHILLYDFFGWKKPVYAHMPLLRNPDRSKLSKRKNPVWASWYLGEGFLPEAMLNYLALMGWSHPEGKEIFSLEEFVEKLDLARIGSVGPVFDVTKLEWMNGEYIRQYPVSSIQYLVFEFFKGKYSKDIVEKTIPLVQERVKTLKEYDEYCRFFIEAPDKYEIDMREYKDLLHKTSEALLNLADWKADKIGEIMQKMAADLGVKNSEFFMAVRVAITGRKVTPPLNESMEILGKKECLGRITNVL